MQTTPIWNLLRLELALDLRQKHAVGGLLLYVISAVYICYLSFQRLIDVRMWNALFWIILLFAAFNALVRTFQREDAGRQLYLYTLIDPRHVILARTLYNIGLMLFLSLIALLFYALFLGQEPLMQADVGQFILVVVLGSIGLAAVLSMISAIAGRAGSGIGLMAILGFPVVLPLLLTIIRASHNALVGMNWSVNIKYVLWLGLIDLITVSLAYILFPYLWRD